MNQLDVQKQITVLIVEDDVIQSLLLEKIITKLGFKVIAVATSAEEAIRTALHDSPDVITMDIFLEGSKDGIYAVEQIHKYNRIPVIYISGNSDQYNFERAKKTEFVNFISKPICINYLAQSFSMIQESLEAFPSKTGS